MLIARYDLNWKLSFSHLKEVLTYNLAEINCQIEHIGSTSVPNLDSKPIIDIDIIYENASDFNLIKSILFQIGYDHYENQGIEYREVFKRNGKIHHELLDTISHHLYVCLGKTAPVSQHLLFRNFLRKNDWARIQYQQLKYELAEQANQNKKRYSELKELKASSFIRQIIANQEELET